jgi:L-ascorbate metabolism protein UlaG (beta-lactamase superfamily)
MLVAKGVGEFIRKETYTGTLGDRLKGASSPPKPNHIVLYWLGQAGFVIDCPNYRLIIDPYLSDSLAQKYRGTAFPHKRMVPPPIVPDELDRLDLVLCTHQHTDHMDPGSLRPLASRFSDLQFVVPAASIEEAKKRCDVSVSRLIPVNVGDAIEVFPGCRILPVPSAHEECEVDTNGHHKWLGYILDIEGVRIYHSGDCIPYPDLEAQIQKHSVDIALLPVNGRDVERSGGGVPGNFTLEEAVSLSLNSGVKVMVAHHYGLFDFNTIAPEVIDDYFASKVDENIELYRAEFGQSLCITTDLL